MFKQPNSTALEFIISLNASTDPAICSAKTTAASFAEGISKTFNNCSIVKTSPSTRLAVEYPLGIEKTALWLTTAVSESLQFSKVRIAVIILVVLAGYIILLAFLLYKIFPVLSSISKHAEE